MNWTRRMKKKITIKQPCQCCHATGRQGNESCWDCRGTGECKWKETLYLALFGPLHGKEIGSTEAEKNGYWGFNRSSGWGKTTKTPTKVWIHNQFKDHVKYHVQTLKTI